MSTDRKELNDAIDSVSRAIDGRPNNWDNDNTMWVLRTLRTATRKHLETLPKTVTKWRVSHKPDDFTTRRTWRMTDSENEALASATHALQSGQRSVSIDKTEEPA